MRKDTQKERELDFLLGKTVSRIYVDFALGVQFFEKHLMATITIEQTLTFRDSGEAFTLLPEVADSLAPVLKIFNTTVSVAVVKSDGTLFLEFSRDRSITVPPHEKYEAWSLNVNDGRKLICMPGGKIASWAAIKK